MLSVPMHNSREEDNILSIKTVKKRSQQCVKTYSIHTLSEHLSILFFHGQTFLDELPYLVHGVFSMFHIFVQNVETEMLLALNKSY